jgi:hypothetical protein
MKNVGVSKTTLPTQIHQYGIGGALAARDPSLLLLKLLRNRTASKTVHEYAARNRIFSKGRKPVNGVLITTMEN